VLGIAVAEVILHGAQIGAVVGEIVLARVAEHVLRCPAKATIKHLLDRSDAHSFALGARGFQEESISPFPSCRLSGSFCHLA